MKSAGTVAVLDSIRRADHESEFGEGPAVGAVEPPPAKQTMLGRGSCGERLAVYIASEEAHGTLERHSGCAEVSLAAA